MTALAAMDPPLPVGVIRSACASDLATPDCAAVILRRDLDPGLCPWLTALPADQLPRARVVLRPQAVRSEVTRICAHAGLPDTARRGHLIDDIARLADQVAGLTQAPYLQIRLDVITTDACRRFHRDAVTARLVCTYRGPGTQLGRAPADARPDAALQPEWSAPTGTPILMRGTLWPETPGAGLLHRSPPIAGSGQTRLVLVIDPIMNPEDAI